MFYLNNLFIQNKGYKSFLARYLTISYFINDNMLYILIFLIS